MCGPPRESTRPATPFPSTPLFRSHRSAARHIDEREFRPQPADHRRAVVSGELSDRHYLPDRACPCLCLEERAVRALGAEPLQLPHPLLLVRSAGRDHLRHIDADTDRPSRICPPCDLAGGADRACLAEGAAQGSDPQSGDAFLVILAAGPSLPGGVERSVNKFSQPWTF